MQKRIESEKTTQRKPAGLIGRRRLVRVLATGGGVATGAALLPSKWTSPIIEAVTLPVHAQTTTAPSGNRGRTFSDQLDSGIADANSIREQGSPIDSLVSPALAVPSLAPITAIEFACVNLEFFFDRVRVTIDTGFDTHTGSVFNPGTIPFDVDVSGPYIVGVAPDKLPIPDNVNGWVVGDGGSIAYDGVQNGECVALTPTPDPQPTATD